LSEAVKTASGNERVKTQYRTETPVRSQFRNEWWLAFIIRVYLGPSVAKWFPARYPCPAGGWKLWLKSLPKKCGPYLTY